MSELFNIPETLSPRLQWMQDHSIKTQENPDGTWCAYSTRMLGENGKGQFEIDAIMDMAIKNNIKLWNQ